MDGSPLQQTDKFDPFRNFATEGLVESLSSGQRRGSVVRRPNGLDRMFLGARAKSCVQYSRRLSGLVYLACR